MIVWLINSELEYLQEKPGASLWMAARLLLMNPFFKRNVDF